MHMGNRLRGFAIAVAATVVAPALLFAQEKPASALKTDNAVGADEPVLMVSITNLDRLTKDVNYVTGTLGQAQAGSIFGMMANTYTNGIDRTRPIGIAVQIVDGMPAPVVLVPTANVKKLLKTFEAQTGPADEFDDGTLAVAAGPNILYIKQVGDWAFAAQARDQLSDLPADPAPWFHGMGDDFDIAIRVNVQALSPDQREQVVAQLKQGFETALAQQPNEQAEQVRQMGTQSLEQLEQVINDTETLQLGFAIQPDNKQLRFEIYMTAAAGTDLASLYAGQKPIPSKFASLVQPSAAGYFHAAGSISSDGIDQAKASLQQATGSVRAALENADQISPDDRAELEAFFERLIEIGADTISEGKSDAGGLLSLDNEELNALAGFFVSDGSKVAQLAKDLAAKIEASGDPNAPTFTFDAAEYKGVTMHYVEADVPEQEAQAREIFGESLRLTIGTGEDAVYLAMGPQAESKLKKLIDDAGKDSGDSSRPLTQGQVRLLPILEFAQSIQENDALAAMIDTLSRAGDTDAVRFQGLSIERGSVTEFTIGEGILRAIGAAVMAQQGRQ
jgi:hypothetical protein